MEQREAFDIYRARGWTQVEAAWAAVHGPAPAPAAAPETETETEAEAG